MPSIAAAVPAIARIAGMSAIRSAVFNHAKENDGAGKPAVDNTPADLASVSLGTNG